MGVFIILRIVRSVRIIWELKVSLGDNNCSDHGSYFASDIMISESSMKLKGLP